MKKPEEFPAQPLALASVPLIAFDPGESTGVCLFDNGALSDCVTVTAQSLCEATIRLRSSFYLGMKLPEETLKAIVVERFTLYPGMALKMIHNSFIAAQQIGIIEVFAAYHLTPITYQSASQAKGLVTEDVLKTYAWYKRLKTRHERDAARHAVYHLNKLHRIQR